MKNFSARMILQNLFHINKVSVGMNDNLYRVSEKLLESFNNHLELDYRMIELASSSQSRLIRSPQMGPYYKDIESCLQNTTNVSIGEMENSCKTILDNLGKIGMLKYLIMIFKLLVFL